MVRVLLAPAFWTLGRLSFRAGYMVAAGLFLLPTLVALCWRAPPEQLYPVIAALVLLAAYAMLALRSFMSIGMARLIRIAERIADGELVGHSIRIAGLAEKNDSSHLWSAILRMNTSLADIVQQVRASAETIAGTSRSIAEGNEQLSRRTQEQAASLEETASGIEQLAAMARQNADSCARADQLAAGSREVATAAAGRMQELGVTMKRIEESARRVGEILGTVEGIAFQTNILALNAAVEAARAGEQGRGFAVVASEVRQLAQRSSTAAREIKALIGDSVGSVRQGRQLVDAAEATMTQVVGSVEEVTRVLGAIAVASREQSGAVAEINQAMVQVDTATQHNAALVEEASASADAFRREAARLVQVVGRFRVEGDGRAGAVEPMLAVVRHERLAAAHAV